MKNTTKKILSMLLAVIMLVAAIPYSASAAETIFEGKYGENLYWSIDDAGKLTLSGSGEAWTIEEYFNYLESFDEEEIQRAQEAFLSIKEMEITESVSQIGMLILLGFHSFPDCGPFPLLEKITVNENNPYLIAEDDVLFNIDKTELIMYPKMKAVSEYVVPQGVKTIAEAAFFGCGTLTDVTISDSVDYIGDRAFLWCRNLKNVKMPEKLNYMGEDVFTMSSVLENVTFSSGITAIKHGTFNGCKLTNFVIPEGVTTIESGSFFCSIQTLRIPKSMEKIEGDSFYYAGSLKDVYYCGSEEEWNKIDISSHQNDPLLNADIYFEAHKDDDGNYICDYCKTNLKPDIDNDNDTDNCSCNCHKKGFSAFIWKILCFFYKIFGMNKTCVCGVAHY